MDKKYYRGLLLDDFQRQAMDYVDNNLSVLVSAPTGVGKTLIADYTIEKCYREGRQVVYTAPIKALSNQKYKDFKHYFGKDAVGIITGDVVINSNAPILVMTTEIFRNMILTRDPVVDMVRYLILDEIHYISDLDRGSVWEETIIFLPKHIKILGLSATIPNAEELAEWIASIKGEEVKVVKHHQRAVPLKHFVFEKTMGAGNLKKAIKIRRQKLEEMAESGVPAGKGLPATTHVDLVSFLKDEYLPALYFVFSRKKCEDYAYELSRKFNFLTRDERIKVEQYLANKSAEQGVTANLLALERVRRVLLKGIGFHHAGMLPIVKEVVEDLLTARLIKVLYCTETFAVGINMPVKTVCFDSNEKFDGKDFRVMTNQEYFQMAGRAGRRGIDTEGFVFSIVDLNWLNPDKMVKPDERKLENLQSRFNLGYNSVVNLIGHHQTEEEIEEVLQHNFAYFQASRKADFLQKRIRELEQELAQILAERCEDIYNLTCPLQYQTAWSRLKADKRELNRLFRTRWGRSKRYESKRKELSLRISQNESLLAEVVPRLCTAEQQGHCQAQQERYRRLDEEKKELYKEWGRLSKQTNFIRDFRLKRQLLQKLGFVDENNALTPRGKFATQIYVQELLVTELYFDGVFHEFEPEQIVALVAAIAYESRKHDWFKKGPVYDLERIYRLMLPLIRAEEQILNTVTVEFHPEVSLLAYQWSAGLEFADLRSYCNLQDGDIVSIFRRTIDLLRQIRGAAAADRSLADKLSHCIKLIDRDVVEFVL
ncbi:MULTISPECIES: RNA helicase [unclassified Carboxydocella]|uniref:DEAD/DEAH box helicase n=1 Tax=unclassified Carboxydocella TaxID=2685367 RepID=UPI0009AE0400|nr:MULTISPECIES: DEAD/DEAH box helicase [unclassified Carboxydocella]